jgi:hypothetical protein
MRGSEATSACFTEASNREKAYVLLQFYFEMVSGE